LGKEVGLTAHWVTTCMNLLRCCYYLESARKGSCFSWRSAPINNFGQNYPSRPSDAYTYILDSSKFEHADKKILDKRSCFVSLSLTRVPKSKHQHYSPACHIHCFAFLKAFWNQSIAVKKEVAIFCNMHKLQLIAKSYLDINNHM
jgi:hypothetical protein